MRILVVTDLYPPAATGGYERSCADVVGRWRRAGHSVTVATTVQKVPSEPGVLRVLPFGDDEIPTDERRGRAAVESIVAELRPDVISAWNLARVPQAGVLAALAGQHAPVVIVASDGWLAAAPQDAALLPRGSHVVWISGQLRDVTTAPPWIPSAHTIVGGGIDGEVFRSRRRPPRPWRDRLLYVGRLAAAKGVEDAIAALRDLEPRARLTVVGHGTAQRLAELRAHAVDLGVADRVSFGQADRAELPSVYGAADVLLFPSRWAEPFGLVPVEAMACSVPVIATGTGGSAGYLGDGGNALLVPPGEPHTIADAVRRLAVDAALRGRLVRHGLRTSRAHDIDGVATALAEVHCRAASAAR